MEDDIKIKQDAIRTYIIEFGARAAVHGTGLPLCGIRSAYTDDEPVYDHLERVYEFYRGLAYERLLSDDDDY